MDEFDRVAIEVASSLLRSEAASPGSQDANLVQLAAMVLDSVRASSESQVTAITPAELPRPAGVSFEAYGVRLNRRPHLLDGISADGEPPHAVLSLIETEDDRRSFDQITRQLGWEHYRCRTWQQAVPLLRKNRVSAILLDNALPVETKRGVVDVARQPGYFPKLVLAYRFSEVRHTPTGGEDGVFLWLWKPFRKDEVRRAMGFALMQCQREWDRYLRWRRVRSPSLSAQNGSRVQSLP